MKVGQLAPALASVFAVDLDGRVRSITRGPDGLWGRWQPEGVNAIRVVHAGSVVATITPDRQVSALERIAGARWVTWEQQALEIRAAHLSGRGPILFANDGETVWRTWKQSPAAEWNAWVPLDGGVTAIDTALLPGGRPALFGLVGGEVVYRYEDQHDGWTKWLPLEAPAGGVTSLQASVLGGGGLVVFAIGRDGHVYHRWQDYPQGTWSRWVALGGPVQAISLTRSPRGGLAVFAVTRDGGVQFRFQHKPFGEWSAWLDLGGRAAAIAAQMSYADGLEVFTVDDDGEVHHKWCERLDWPWTDWTPLDYEASPLRDRKPIGR